MQFIVTELKTRLEQACPPIVLFTKGGGQWLESIADTGCDAIGLDWTTEIGSARSRVGQRVALQGNLDPNILYAGVERIQAEARYILDDFGSG